jgi:hypothetical protein
MNFDRSLLALFVVTMIATIVKAPYPICETLGLLCGLQTLRSHAKAMSAASAAIVKSLA